MVLSPDANIYWVYRCIDLSAVTSPIWRTPIRPSQAFPWLMHKMRALYFSDAEDPSGFDTITFDFGIVPREKNLMNQTFTNPLPPITLTLNPGLRDVTAGTRWPKVFYFPSPVIDWIVRANEPFTFNIENHSALTGSLQILFIGYLVVPEGKP